MRSDGPATPDAPTDHPYGPTQRRPAAEVTSIDRYGNRAWLDDSLPASTG